MNATPCRKFHRKGPRTRLLALAALAAALSVVPGRPADATPGKLSISTGVWVGYGPLFLARDLGYFKQGGLDVDIIQQGDTLSLTSMIASGAISGSSAEIDIMLPIRKNTCVKGVVPIDDSSGADGIVTTPDITQLSQLKGKDVAVSETGYPNVFFSYALKQGGVPRSSVTMENMRPDDAAAAFIAGRVPVAVTYEPSLTFVADAHKGRVLFTSREAPGLIVDLIYLRCEVLQQQPKDVKTLVDGVIKAADYIKANPDRSYDIMRQYVGGFLGTREDFATAAKGVRYYDRPMSVRYMGTKDHPGQVMDTVNFIYDVWGPIVPKYSYDELFDPSFLD